MRPGMVRDFPGTLADYRHHIETLFATESAPAGRSDFHTPADAVPDEKTLRIKERDERKKVQRSIEKCERRIAEQESTIAALNDVLHDPANALDHILLQETAEQHAREQSGLDQLLQEWEKLQTAPEKLV